MILGDEVVNFALFSEFSQYNPESGQMVEAANPTHLFLRLKAESCNPSPKERREFPVLHSAHVFVEE